MKCKIFLILASFSLLLWPMLCLAQLDLPGQYCLVDHGWEKKLVKNGITIYAQKSPHSSILGLKATGILKAPVDQLMAVLREVEISEEWMPHIKEKYTVRDFSDLEAITYSINKLPWPFADREMLLHNRLRLDKENKYLVVDVYSVNLLDIPVKKSSVRAHMYCGRTLLRPAGENRTEVELILYIDPKGSIPVWLVNMVQKTMPYNFLTALEQKAMASRYELRPGLRKMLDSLLTLLDSQYLAESNFLEN